MSDVYYATHDGKVHVMGRTGSMYDEVEIVFHRRTRWQQFLHALSTPLRVRLVVRP